MLTMGQGNVPFQKVTPASFNRVESGGFQKLTELVEQNDAKQQA
jgi:hypothetical protein